MKQWADLALDRPLVMGILNVTPDSFSDGGRHADPVASGLAMIRAGADIVDVGGESTRPNAAPVPVAEELARVVPVIAALADAGAVISVDTRNAAVMAAALDAGARIVNDVSGLRHDPAGRALVAARGCSVILMHMRGSPATMNCMAHYTDLVPDVIRELRETRDLAVAAGVAAANIALDPGLGFAKLGAQNFALLQAIPQFAALGQPLVIGLSRKKFIGEAMGEPVPAKRVAGSLAAGLYAVARGAHIVRVHDVAETVGALKIWNRLNET
jgi:dihydropteroate synthase